MQNDEFDSADNGQLDAFSIFTAVAEKDYNSLFHGFVLSAAKSIVSAYPVPGKGSTKAGAAFGEQKCDEYFHRISQQFGNGRTLANSHAKHGPSYNLLLVELLNSLLCGDPAAYEVKEAALMEALEQEGDKYTKNVGWRHARRRKSNKYSILQQMHEDDEEAMRFSSKLLSNTRPPSNFVLHSKTSKGVNEKNDCQNELEKSNHSRMESSCDANDNTNEDDDESMASDTEYDESIPPLFDGSIGASAGSLLHLACIVDDPFILAMLLVLGAEPRSKYSAFRRLPVHEAACSNSTNCLAFLLDLSRLRDQTYSELSKSLSDKLPVAHFLPLMLLGQSKNLSSTPSFSLPRAMRDTSITSSSTASMPAHSPNTAPVHFPFISTLRTIQLLVRKMSLNQLTPLQAAKKLIEKAPLTHSMKAALTSSLSHTLLVSDGHGNTALHWAAFKNSPKCISILLDAGANPNARAHTTGWTPLHDAAYSDAPEATKLLLEGGANVNAQANSGATPLCFAAQEDAPRAAEMLLQAGADTSVRCCGHTFAASMPNPDRNNGNGHGLLFPQGPMIASRFSGYTPLHYCAHYNAARAAKVLMKYGAPIEIIDFAHRLPIHVAVARGSSGVLRELLIAGAKVERDTNDQPMENMEEDESNNSQSSESEMGTEYVHPNEQQQQQQQIVEYRQVNNDPNLSNNLLRNPDTVNIGSPTASPITTPNVITPASSPVLKQMLPREPINSAKPWNCLSQESIDECISLIEAAEGHWSPGTHRFFSPKDRRGVMEFLRVGKRLEQHGTGFLDLWPHVLSYCGREWFEEGKEIASPVIVPTFEGRKNHTANRIRHFPNGRHSNIEEGIEDSSSSSDSHIEDDFTQFHLDADHHY